MVHRMWKHGCGCEKHYLASGAENCPRCGQPGEFAGWARSVVEQMGHTQSRTGYPFNPKLAKYRLPILKEPCPDCEGTGLVDVNHGQTCRDCERCHGNGGLPLYAPEIMRLFMRRAREWPALERSYGLVLTARPYEN
jgi:hypothetical protein